MLPMTLDSILLGMGACLFVLGLISTGAGIIILISKSMGSELKEITQQTAKLAQHGIADDMAGLVGNASSLIEALNQLVRTSSGVGIFLVIAGFILLGASYFLVVKMLNGPL